MAEKLSIEKIKELIDNFQGSQEYRSLNDMQKRITFLDIFHKTRRETYHSAIIAWILGCEDFNILSEPPVLLLLKLVNNINKKDKSSKIATSLVNLIDSGTLRLKKATPDTEVQTFGNQENGRVDIVIETEFNDTKATHKIRLVIENKIDSKEGKDQCKKYEEHFEKKQDGYSNVYIFLAPYKPEKLSDGKCNFIAITYQELLDNVLYPIAKYKTDYSAPSFYLREYINTITSINTDKILAMNDEYKNLLMKLYNDNVDLINALIDVAYDDDPKTANNVKNSLAGGAKQYTISYPNGQTTTVNGHSKLAYQIALYLAQRYSQQDIISKYNSIGSKKKTEFILDKAKTAKKKDKTVKMFTGDAIKCTDDIEVWCSNQWTPETVEILIDVINNSKEDIQIEKG